MRKAFVLAAVILQVAVLAYMAGEREYILRMGKVIHLRTAPIDPRDLFRGDYVRLNYDISRIAPGQVKDAEDIKEIKKGDKLYVNLQETPSGLYELTHAQLRKPGAGLYLTGRFTHPHKSLEPGNPLWVTYGIEAYFVEQGTGGAIEKRRGNATGVQVPLEMEIAVGAGGKAVIRGYRWSPLGFGLQVLRSPPTDTRNGGEPDSAAVRVTLLNVSDTPLAIVALPNDCSFSLEPVPWAKSKWTLVNSPCGSDLPTDADVVFLAPQQEKSVDLDFSSDRWLVKADGVVSRIGALEPSEQFRIVYRPPSADDCTDLENRDPIWHGNLPSRVFHGRGRID